MNDEIIVNGLILKQKTGESDDDGGYVYEKLKNAEIKINIDTKIKCIPTYTNSSQYRTLEDYLKTGGYMFNPNYLNDESWKNNIYPTFTIEQKNGAIQGIEEVYHP